VLVIVPSGFYDYGYLLTSDGTLHRSIDAAGETNFSWWAVDTAAAFEELNLLARPLDKVACSPE
jgi:hypothetical protein